MSLRLQVNLIVAVLMTLFLGVLVFERIEDTRSSVREEIEGSNRVAMQLLTRVSGAYEQAGVRGMLWFLNELGRLRANEVLLYDPSGQLVYASPASTYKSGRDAPHWFSRLVSPDVQSQQIQLAGGRLVVRADSSRAVLDGWDELRQLLGTGLAIFALANLIVFWLVGRALAPLRHVLEGLRRMEQGDYSVRLPALRSGEGALMSAAFNRMAQAVADTASARRGESEARRSLEESRDLSQMIQAHVEEERRSIARELHDEVGQSVTAIRSIARALEQKPDAGPEAVRESAHLIGQTATVLYDSVHELIPKLRSFTLDSFGLADALGELVGEWQRRHPQVRLHLSACSPVPETSDAVTTCAYRIVQEALTNAMRHAGASVVEVALEHTASELIVEVCDNGSGLDPAVPTPGHFGLAGMRERAAGVHGACEIGPGPTGGTRVLARLPLL